MSAATTNRALGVLRRMLRPAHEWRIIDRIPKRLLRAASGIASSCIIAIRERISLEFCPQILHDTAVLMLDTGLGPAEALALSWNDIHPDIFRSARGRLDIGRAAFASFRASLRCWRSAGAIAKLACASARESEAEAKISSVVRVIFVKAYGAHPLEGNWGRCLHHHANCRTFVDQHSQRYVHRSSETVGLAIARLDMANQQALQQSISGK